MSGVFSGTAKCCTRANIPQMTEQKKSEGTLTINTNKTAIFVLKIKVTCVVERLVALINIVYQP